MYPLELKSVLTAQWIESVVFDWPDGSRHDDLSDIVAKGSLLSYPSSLH